MLYSSERRYTAALPRIGSARQAQVESLTLRQSARHPDLSMTEQHIPAPSAQRKLTGTEKAAALLLAVGKENASKILAQLDDEDIRVIARSASDLGAVSQATLDSIAEEFVIKVTVDGGLRGSSENVERLLEEIMPQQQVRQIMADVRARMNEAVWPRLVDLPAHVLAQFLNKEHPQVVTFILSKTSASLTAEVVAAFPTHLRNEVMRRMLTHKLVTQQSLRLLEQVLRDELLLKVAKTTGQDTHERVAKIVNKLGKKEMEEVLDSIGATRPKEAETVRGLLFTFDDIRKLPARTRVALFEAIEAERLVPALNGADDALKDFILSSVPSRTRRVIEQDLAAAPPLTEKEVEKARREIADFALQLADQGAISLAFAEAED
ncbi:MAG TPA: FliG C-terminal domain-containing protein [Rhodomicrobium sp.]|nr:FliG C-terminal domain-containing protein [Rhodomicrobium sp.]